MKYYIHKQVVLCITLLWLTTILTGSTVLAQRTGCDPSTYVQNLEAYALANENPDQEQRPVILVHGFTGDVDDWGREEDAESIYGQLIRRYDKSLIHRLSYPPGPDGQPYDKADATCTARYLMEAVDVLSRIDRQIGGNGKVDIVAHSLGGLITRQLLGYRDISGPHQVQYSGNIGRFIDLATPHSGSAYIDLYNKGADAMADAWGTSITGNKIAQPIIRSAIRDLFNTLEDIYPEMPNPESPAGRQLAPDSEFIKNLNQRPSPGDVDYYLLYGDIGFDFATKFFDIPVTSNQVASVGDLLVSKDNATTIPNLGSLNGPNPSNYQLFGFEARTTLSFDITPGNPEIKIDAGRDFLSKVKSVTHGEIPDNEAVKQKVLALLESDYVAVEKTVTPFPSPVVTPTQPGRIDSVKSRNTATVLLFDTSGSMDRLEPGGVKKIDAAMTAADDILNLIGTENELSSGAHQVGVASFSEGANTRLTLSSDIGLARQAISGFRPYGGTNMAAGLDKSIDSLKNAPEGTARILLLLSDGQPTTSNKHPYSSNPSQAGVEELKREILSEQVPRAKSANICIFAIGFGDPGASSDLEFGLDEAFLGQVADGSGCGEYYNAQNAFELSEVYLKSRHQATGKLIAERSGKIRQGETITLEGFQVAPGARSLHVSVRWPGSQLALQLVDPQGRTVDEAYPNSLFKTFGNLIYLVIQNPVVGQWQMSLEGIDVPSGITDCNVLVSTRAPDVPSPFNILYIAGAMAVVGGLLLFFIYNQQPATLHRGAATGPPGLESPGLGVVGFRRGVIAIGRHPRDDITLPATIVSRHHARVLQQGQRYVLEDLNSNNGTFVNGRRVTQCSLSHGDQIKIGDTTLIFKTH